ncbi:hypothetical protein KGP36_07740 [Patescibacteria group bacterium]|nr:hypothetical protein [Patescibacteria group bacterium]
MLWNSIATQWSLAGLYKKIGEDSVRYYLNAKSTAERDMLAQEQIDQMTNFYKLTLEDRFQKQYPSSLKDMMTFVLNQQRELKSYANYRDELYGANDAALPMVGSYGNWQAFPYGTSLLTADNGVYGYGSVFGKPLYFISGPIDNTILAGEAENGSYVGIVSMKNGADMSSQLLYINYGTKASPNWHTWNPLGLVDCILDGEPLLECGYQRVRYYIRDFATDSDEGETFQRLEKMPVAAKIAKDRATEQESVAFGLIRIDLSNIGTASDASTQSDERSGQFF